MIESRCGRRTEDMANRLGGYYRVADLFDARVVCLQALVLSDGKSVRHTADDIDGTQVGLRPYAEGPRSINYL